MEFEDGIPYEIRLCHSVAAWRKPQCGASKSDKHSHRTRAESYVYDPAHEDYPFTPAFVK